MLKEERQTWILNKLHSSGKVVVSHLAGELKVSEDTIRRDLLDLDQKGQLKRVFGGAIPLEKPVINFFDRETADVALKQQLAMRALEFLEPDQLVAIDGSSIPNAPALSERRSSLHLRMKAPRKKPHL